MKRLFMMGALAGLVGLSAPPIAGPAAAAAGEVLILGSTVSGGASSTLAQKFVLAGKTPVVVSDATWSSMTAAQFDAYDAIVLGDPSCSGTPPAAAVGNAATWSSVVDGNVIIIGTDETFHQSQGGSQLMESGAAFAVAQANKTGAYISLSCYYHGTAANTPVPLLSGLGAFTATGVGCFDDAHIVATHPALTGLTDASLSNWSCSVHEAFDSWPASFQVLAIAEGAGGSFTAGDGSVGTPYILANGVAAIGGGIAECAENGPVPRGYELITGTDGNDVLTGDSGKDLIRGRGGNDTIRAYSSDDILCGGVGDDTIYAGSGHDLVSGGPGNDRLYGESGNDEIHGEAGTDTLDGSSGTDRGIDADTDTTRISIERTN